MTDIVVHTFKDQQVRTAADRDGNPLFNLGDVAAALEIKDVARLASRLEDDLRQTHPILDRLGRIQNATFVTEAGLYEVVLRSDKPEAKPFRRWVTSEVLPSIRKTGAYSLQPTQRRIEQGLVRPQVRPIHLPGGRLIESVTTLITGKGQEDLINGFLNGSYTI